MLKSLTSLFSRNKFTDSHLLFLSGHSYFFTLLAIISAMYLTEYVLNQIFPMTTTLAFSVLVSVVLAFTAHHIFLQFNRGAVKRAPLQKITMRWPPFILWVSILFSAFHFYLPWQYPSMPQYVIMFGFVMGVATITPLMMFHSPKKHQQSFLMTLSWTALAIFVDSLAQHPEMLREPFYTAILIFLLSVIMPGLFSAGFTAYFYGGSLKGIRS